MIGEAPCTAVYSHLEQTGDKGTGDEDDMQIRAGLELREQLVGGQGDARQLLKQRTCFWLSGACHAVAVHAGT